MQRQFFKLKLLVHIIAIIKGEPLSVELPNFWLRDIFRYGAPEKICFYLSATTFANWALIRVSPMIRNGTSAGERADWMSATVDVSSKIRAACARTATLMIDVLNTMTKIMLVAKIMLIEIKFIFNERKLQSTSTLFCQKFGNFIFIRR